MSYVQSYYLVKFTGRDIARNDETGELVVQDFEPFDEKIFETKEFKDFCIKEALDANNRRLDFHLSHTDKFYIRQADIGKEVPKSIQDERAGFRAKHKEIETEIKKVRSMSGEWVDAFNAIDLEW